MSYRTWHSLGTQYFPLAKPGINQTRRVIGGINSKYLTQAKQLAYSLLEFFKLKPIRIPTLLHFMWLVHY